MKFRIDSYIPPTRAQPVTERQEKCEACDRYKDNRCTATECGCPNGAWRIQPWDRMSKCPLNKWSRIQG